MSGTQHDEYPDRPPAQRPPGHRSRGPRPRPATRCETCQERARNCLCPEGPDLP